MKENAKIIVCPPAEKIRILQSFSYAKEILPITFYTKEEFYQKYFFSYDENTIYTLMKNYHLQYDICLLYLKWMRVVDIQKEYSLEKLEFLRKIKKDLINQNLLFFHPAFLSSLASNSLEIHSYYDLDLWEEEIFHSSFLEDIPYTHDIYEYETMEEEVNAVCIQILELLKNGHSLSSIYLCNVGEDYYYTIDRLFSYYHIPVSIPYHRSIYGNNTVQKYLKTGELDLEEDSSVLPLLVSCINSIPSFDWNDSIWREILIHKLQATYYPNPSYKEAVSIVDLSSREFGEEDIVFVLGINQEQFPIIHKDTDYLSDVEKEGHSFYTTTAWNKKEKIIAKTLLRKIPHAILSYKLRTPFVSFYPSTIIDEFSFTVKKGIVDTYSYSNLYNQIRLGKKLDTYRIYKEESPFLRELNCHYKIPYLKYTNQFSGIDKDFYLTHISYPLKLSYTSFNAYQECKFKYYLNFVLKLNSYEETFSSFIGSMFHKLLSLCFLPNFSFEEEYQNFLEKRDLSLKEVVLLTRIKKEFLKLYEVLKKQKSLTGFDDSFYEKRIEVPIREDISVYFVGVLDKILYYQKIEDTYFSIIDYKSGDIDTHLEPMKYGLHMQLPVYLYLMHYGRVFHNPIFAGIYYQNILFNYPKWDESPKNLEKRYYLDGYSTDDISILERMDSTYLTSEMIKGMKYSDDKGFDRYSKVLSNESVFDMVQYTKKKIEETTQSILDADFMINPKKMNKENLSCQYCPYKDICFMRESNCIELEKVVDFSFLGGE